ncbi:MAG: LysR family transcriptional regulator [Myxococcaceae bacterium]|nr:LysR family transcriptional regulator [Myxococcaceae bacterium]
MQLKHLRSFVAVAESGHFRRAASSLGVTQPAISHHIAALEEEVGTRLLQRDRRNVELTAAGAVLLEGAKAAMERLDEAEAAARALGEARARTLVVGQLDYVSHVFLPPAVRALKAPHPDVTVETLDRAPEQTLAAVRDGTVDLGFVCGSSLARAQDLVKRTVARGHWCLILPRSHALARLDEVPLERLASEPVILFHRRVNPDLSAWVHQQCERAGFTLKVAHQVAQSQHGPALVAQGVGVFMVGSYHFNELPENLVSRPLVGMPTGLSVVATWRPGRRSPLLKAFLEGLPRLDEPRN